MSILKASPKKLPVAPEVDLAFLVKNTPGSSGADLMEICQWAAKLAIQASIDTDIGSVRERREHEEAEDTKMKEDSDEADDPIP